MNPIHTQAIPLIDGDLRREFRLLPSLQIFPVPHSYASTLETPPGNSGKSMASFSQTGHPNWTGKDSLRSPEKPEIAHPRKKTAAPENRSGGIENDLV
jgi:hypothetical protein